MSHDTDQRRYTSHVANGGALLPETRFLLAQWDLSLTLDENLCRAQMENTMGKTSRNRVARILTIFRRRYASNPDVLKALIVFAKSNLPQEILDRILCFCVLQDDPLLMDAAVCVLAPAYSLGQVHIDTTEVEDWLNTQCAAGLIPTKWSSSTTARVARGILSTLRDFGLLEGKATKRFRAAFMPVEACAFMSFLLYQKHCSGELVIHDSSWQVFHMNSFDVEHVLVEATGRKLLQYNAAGNVIRIDYPAGSAEEYARVIVEKQN